MLLPKASACISEAIEPMVRRHLLSTSLAMSVSGYKRLTIVLSVVSAALLMACASLLWSHAWLSIRVAFASEQTRIFDEMRMQALQSDAREAARCLEYVVSYYPSGTKQETGSRLDQIVERDRSLAARDIVAHLRTQTGEDLGENPKAWIQKDAEE
jgi:hypothetical protein